MDRKLNEVKRIAEYAYRSVADPHVVTDDRLREYYCILYDAICAIMTKTEREDL